jgi:hypothetical protein
MVVSAIPGNQRLKRAFLGRPLGGRARAPLQHRRIANNTTIWIDVPGGKLAAEDHGPRDGSPIVLAGIPPS